MEYPHEQVAEALSGFDFEAIATYMNAVGWTYNDKKVNAEAVKQVAHTELHHAILKVMKTPHQRCVYSRGGWKADAAFNDGSFSILLSFTHTARA